VCVCARVCLYYVKSVSQPFWFTVFVWEIKTPTDDGPSGSAEFDSATYTLVVDVFHIVRFVGRSNRRRGDEDTNVRDKSDASEIADRPT